MDYCKKFDPQTEVVLYRLPKQELREIAAIPCPSDNLQVI